MDSFQVSAKDTTILDSSHLVAELQSESREMEMFPALIGTQIGYFHDIDGGYASIDKNNSFNEGGYHVVNLIHRVQGPDSPPNKRYAQNIELHLNDWFYNLSVTDVCIMGEDYPDSDFVLSLKVTDYMMGKQSFSEALATDIDKREQEFSPNGEQ